MKELRWMRRSEPINEPGLWEIRNSYKILIENFKEKGQLHGPRHGLECNFKIDPK